ncbi:bifunctional 4-hydroxy-2-oxoglutarate aldolase/2-dehydro-3-deoxy-phosphogluconate aldolase [uncultured Succinatimonas sp.]|uniref:bifunctional 4-hydroxy-2-oxoglutarate aldolase/2-dehydro-3-deoxy-phosphogluconate aldolase n=1 Tax=uncultured Succinatimonas sp. TaxID=1262973 RepID=UPI0025D5766E|nr:bifunctional 4-hydroxy-2-oxoglutarate aldolase/2-dehydro-3-deoxy-phosphogluconate aldolase [uncultured Succinatimonas sp.]
MNTLDFIYEKKLVAISRGVYGDNLLKASQIINEEGICLLEITFDQSSATNLIDTPKSIEKVKNALGDKMCVGAGTVMTIDQARAAKAAGADFALAPNTDVAVIHEMKKLGLIAVPGAFTPSEVATAYNEGADIVKLFPASILGLEYVKAFRAPINHIPLMAVGGVSVDNVKDFLSSGFMSAGVGSHIINAKKIAAGDFDGVRNAAKGFVAAIK